MKKAVLCFHFTFCFLLLHRALCSIIQGTLFLLFRGSVVAAAQDIRAIFIPLTRLGSQLRLGCALSCAAVFALCQNGELWGYRDLTWMFTHSAKPVNLNVLLYQSMIHTGLVHMDCCEELPRGCPASVSTIREEHGITLFSGMLGWLTFIGCFVLACTSGLMQKFSPV